MAGFSDRSPRLASPRLATSQVGSRTLDPEPWRGYGGRRIGLEEDRGEGKKGMEGEGNRAKVEERGEEGAATFEGYGK